MKKILLSLILIAGINFIAGAQCLTCKQGQHDTNDKTAITVPYRLNTPVTGHVTNGNQTLAQSYIQQNVCGLNYATASVLVETRSKTWSFNDSGSGFPAPLNILGLCGINSPLKAYVYYDASYTEPSAPPTTVTIKNPASVTNTYSSVLIGTGPSKCWGETGTAVYRADVTAAVSGNGNYSLTSINGFTNAASEVDGATLIIIYATSATYSGSIVLWDGCWTLIGGTANYTGTGFSACAASSTVDAFGVYGDMQDNVNAGLNTETFNGVTKTFWNNFWNFNLINGSLTSGQSSYVYDSYTNNGGDCWLWALSGLYWQNTGCVACAPHSLTTTITQVNPTCGNSNGSITIGVSGGIAPYTYTWSPNVSTTANATGLSVGVYVITVTDSTGCNSSVDTVKLINSAAPTLTVSTVNVKCYGQSGGSATVNAVGGTPPYTYLWSPGGGTTATITGLTAGSYTILVTDGAGCQSVDIAYVTQPTKLSVAIDSVHGLLCSNSGPVGAIWVSGSGGTPGYTYLWNPGGNTNSFETGLSQGTYSVQVTDANGCVADSSILLTTVNPIVMSVSSFDASCGYANGCAYISTISGGTPPYTYMWSNGYPFSFNCGLSAGLYCCTVTDANGCTDSACVTVNNFIPFTISVTWTPPTCHGGNNASATATVTGSGSPWTYLWTPSNQTNATATALTAATYTVKVTDNSGCSGSEVITITQPPAILLTVSPMNDTICVGDSVRLNAVADSGVSPYTFRWSTGTTGSSCTVHPTVTTTYSVKVTDANGCTDSLKNIKVDVRPPLSVSISPNNAATCQGVSTTFTATATGGDGVYSYVWAPGGQTSATITVSPSVTTVYTVTVHDTCNTPPASAIVTLTIYPQPVAGFVSDSLAGCSPLCVTLTDTSKIAVGGTITKWQWNFGDGSPVDTLQNPKHCYPVPGQYTLILKVTSNKGCTSADTVNNYLTVYHHPNAAFILAPQPTTIIQPTIYFTDQSTDSYGGIATWFWTFGDNLDSTSIHQDAVHTYQDTGTFCATLKVTNKFGCIDSITNCLVIEPQFTLYIPSAFTPNGNGLNDVFLPKGDAIKQFDMYVFDRWGNQLFHSNSIFIGWDGRVKGVMSEEDTYVYLIDVVDNNNKKHSYIGNINMIR